MPRILTRKDVDTLFDDYLEHLVPNDIRSVPTYRSCIIAFSCIRWYYIMSHVHMLGMAEGGQKVTLS